MNYLDSHRKLNGTKVKQAIEDGYSIKDIHTQTKIDPWFLSEIKMIVDIKNQSNSFNKKNIIELKKEGFSDIQIGFKYNKTPQQVRQFRKKNQIIPTYKVVDTCAAEFEALTPYCYSTYEQENEIVPLEGKKIIILGGGPNRIGQGIEFDYCCVQAVFGLKDLGYKTIMINCNPETVSTDFDIADRLYFEPLTFEDVMNIIDFENPDGVVVQFGGQTPLNIASELKINGVNIIGTSPDSIDLAENRKKFGKILKQLNIPAPSWGTAFSVDEAQKIANRIKYPVLVRPSYVLGGRGMQIVYDDDALKTFVGKAALVSGDHPILIDAFLENAFEFDVDAICDGKDVFISGIMQHIEEAGIHSGDSSCVFPPYELSSKSKKTIEKYTKTMALQLNTVGLINIQFAVKDEVVYVIEVNPRASRTIPFISKVIDIPIAKIAAQVGAGIKIKDLKLKHDSSKGLIAIKKPVFPFNKFPNQSLFLSPEMKSTGEVIGFDDNLGSAYAKATLGAGNRLPTHGAVFMSVNESDKMDIIPIGRDFKEFGFDIIATTGTAKVLVENGVKCKEIYKVG